MREILFRGKRISNGEWVYGGIMKTFHPNYDSESEEDFLHCVPNCYCICANGKDYYVEQDSVGQYTGVTDKNGKKIFEGDIVRVLLSGDTKPVGVVEYGTTGIMSFCVRTEKGYSNYVIENSEDFEVIGNKFENPELLEVEE